MSDRDYRSKDVSQELKECSSLPGNDKCADCNSQSPSWGSLGFGVMVCIKCSGVHRSLGVHITKVKSVSLDQWDEADVYKLQHQGGNTAVNQSLEKYLTRNKPSDASSQEERTTFIKQKYLERAFSIPNDQNTTTSPSNTTSPSLANGSFNNSKNYSSSGDTNKNYRFNYSVASPISSSSSSSSVPPAPNNYSHGLTIDTSKSPNRTSLSNSSSPRASPINKIYHSRFGRFLRKKKKHSSPKQDSNDHHEDSGDDKDQNDERERSPYRHLHHLSVFKNTHRRARSSDLEYTQFSSSRLHSGCSDSEEISLFLPNQDSQCLDEEEDGEDDDDDDDDECDEEESSDFFASSFNGDPTTTDDPPLSSPPAMNMASSSVSRSPPSHAERSKKGQIAYTGMVTIKLWGARHIPFKDRKRTCNPICWFRAGSQEVHSTKIKRSASPYWGGEEIRLCVGDDVRDVEMMIRDKKRVIDVVQLPLPPPSPDGSGFGPMRTFPLPKRKNASVDLQMRYVKLT